MIQGSDEWFAARLGKLTASRVSDMIAKTKTGYGASRANYLAELVVERITGERGSTFTNDAMRWGTEHEADARAAYEFRHDVAVTEVGFIDHPSIPMSGASPDGCVGSDGLIEIKCPYTTKTHIETLLRQTPPTEYLDQMQWQMVSTGRQWVDFISFDPRMPEEMTLFVSRVQRDDKRIAELEREALAFLKEVDQRVADLRTLYIERKSPLLKKLQGSVA